MRLHAGACRWERDPIMTASPAEIHWDRYWPEGIDLSYLAGESEGDSPILSRRSDGENNSGHK